MFKAYLKKHWLDLLIASLIGAGLMAGMIVYTVFTGGLGLVTLPYVGAFISTVMSQFLSFGLVIQIVSAVGVSLATGLMSGLLTLGVGLGITGIRQHKLKKEAPLGAKQEQKKDTVTEPDKVAQSIEAKSVDNIPSKKISAIKRWFYEKIVAKFSTNKLKQLAAVDMDFAAKVFAKPELKNKLDSSEKIDVLNKLITDENAFNLFQQKLKNYGVNDITAILINLMPNPIFIKKTFDKQVLHCFIDKINFDDSNIGFLIAKSSDDREDLRKDLINLIAQIVGVSDTFKLLDKLNHPMLVLDYLTNLVDSHADMKTSGKSNWLQQWLDDKSNDENEQARVKSLFEEANVIEFFDTFPNTENKLLAFIKLLDGTQCFLDELSCREKVLDVFIRYKSLLEKLSDERRCEIIFAEDYDFSKRENKKTTELILKSINIENLPPAFLARIPTKKINDMCNMFKEDVYALLPLLTLLWKINRKNSLEELCRENNEVFDLVFSYQILADELTDQYKQEVIFSADITFFTPNHNENIKETLQKLENNEVSDYLKPYLTMEKSKTLFIVFQNDPSVLKILLKLLARNLLEKDKTLDNLCKLYPKLKELVFSHYLLAEELSYDYRTNVLTTCDESFITKHSAIFLHIITHSAWEMAEFIKNPHGKRYLMQMDALQFAAIGSKLKNVDAVYYNDLAETADYQEICNVFHNKLYGEAKESRDLRDKIVQDPNANFYFSDKELIFLKGLHKLVSFKHAYNGKADQERFQIARHDYKEALEYLAKANNLPNYKSDSSDEIDKANKAIDIILSHTLLIQVDFCKNDILNKNLKLGQFALIELGVAEKIINDEVLSELLDIFELAKIKEKYCKCQALDVKAKNAFSYFNLTENSDYDDFKQQFKKLSLQHHPDKGGDPEKFKEMQDFYRIAEPILNQRKNIINLENKINMLINNYLQNNIPNWNIENQENIEKGKKLLSHINRHATFNDKEYFYSAFKLVNDQYIPIPIGKLALMDYNFAKLIIDNDRLVELVDINDLSMLKKYDYSNKLNKGNLEFFKLTEHSTLANLDTSFIIWLLQKLTEFKKDVKIDNFLKKIKDKVEIKNAAINVINSLDNKSKADDFELEDLKQTYDELLRLSTIAKYKSEKIKKECELYANVKKAYEPIKTVFDFNEKLADRIKEKEVHNEQSNNKLTFRRR